MITKAKQTTVTFTATDGTTHNSIEQAKIQELANLAGEVEVGTHHSILEQIVIRSREASPSYASDCLANLAPPSQRPSRRPRT